MQQVQLINATNSDLLSEIALKCGDIYFKDFPKNIYIQGLFRAQRSIAKELKILDRVWQYTNTTGTSPIDITPLNFDGGAWRITVTPDDGDELVYKKVQVDEVLNENNSDQAYCALMYNVNRWTLYYVGAAADDVISIYHTASISSEEDYELTDPEGNAQLIPAIPNKYDEEVIRRTVRYIAQLGIANFAADKRDKYLRVLQVYTRKDDENRELHLDKTRPFIKIKPHIYP